MDTLDDLARLSDADLLAGMQQVVASESRAIARVVAYLAELDKRRLYLARGFTSLFKYCTHALRLSEDATFNRIEVARAARRHPVVLAHLASGDLTLTAIRLLAPHLTSENHERLLSEARHKGLDDIRHLIARCKPQPPVPSSIRKLPVSRDSMPGPVQINSQPGDVQRKVWSRDDAQCAFKGDDGRRCSETGCLEYHHVVPFAAGGQATADNVELRCRAHNGYEAERYFGAEVMSLFREVAPAYR